MGTQTVVKTRGCYPRTDSRAPLLKATHIQLIECGKVKWMPTQDPFMFQCLWYGKVLYKLPTEKCKHQSTHKIFDLHHVLPSKYVTAWWHKACWINEQMLNLTYSLLHDMESTPNNVWVTMNQRLDSYRPGVKPNTSVLQIKK